MIDENPPIQPKRRSSRGASRPIQIQERDLAILYSLSVGRYLTVPAIEWLHYPTWRERYKVFLERQKTDEALFYRPLNHVYRRLIALRAGEVPLVYRLTSSLSERTRVWGRASIVSPILVTMWDAGRLHMSATQPRWGEKQRFVFSPTGC